MNCKVTILHPIRFSINNNINKNSILESLRSLLVLIFRLFEIAVFIRKVKTRALGKGELESFMNKLNKLTFQHLSAFINSYFFLFFLSFVFFFRSQNSQLICYLLLFMLKSLSIGDRGYGWTSYKTQRRINNVIFIAFPLILLT